jgi:hypothetical protein
VDRVICKAVFVTAMVVLASGCVRNAALVRFEREHECTKDVAIKNLGAHAYRVSGCGRTVTYVCHNRVCVIESDDGGRSASNDEQDLPRTQGQVASAPPRSYDHVQDGVTSTKSAGGRVINAQFGNQSLSMHLQSVPKTEERKLWLGMRLWTMQPKHKTCPLQLMVNGELLTLDPPRYKHERGYEELQVQISYEQLYSLAEGPRIVGRICDDEFRLNDENIAILRELVSRIYEELSWANMLTPEDQARHDKDKAEPAAEGASSAQEL